MILKNKFQPSEWLNTSNTSHDKQPLNTALELQKVEQIIRYIELNKVDITQGYKQWLKIGFALSSAFGGGGRELFHRLSSIHPTYVFADCDKQFTYCLDSTGEGITLSTFYYYADIAGVPKNNPVMQLVPKPIENPTNPIFPLLPDLPPSLQKILDLAKDEQAKWVLLVGNLAAQSACLPNVMGYYGNDVSYVNLNLFMEGSASIGKGILRISRKLVNPVDQYLKDQYQNELIQYKKDLKYYKNNHEKNPTLPTPTKPIRKMLFLPANSSSSGMLQLLAENGGAGLIFETEGDTMVNAFKSDYGNYSDSFRKAFHHEEISFFRRTGDEYVGINNPRLSTVLTGTRDQLKSLIPSPQNGLFSRFMYYQLIFKKGWHRDLLKKTRKGYTTNIDEVSDGILNLYKILSGMECVELTPTDAQSDKFDDYFEQLDAKYSNPYHDDFVSAVRRLGLITLRIGMILTMLRRIGDSSVPKKITIDDKDWDSAIAIIGVLVKQSYNVYTSLYGFSSGKKPLTIKEQFLEALPEKFDRAKYLETAIGFGIKDKTAENYVTKWVEKGQLGKPEHNQYQKNE
jgi:hypothetical protein